MKTLEEEFRRAWATGQSLDQLLVRLVEQTSARAAGCWRLKDSILHLAGFGWAGDMPAEVSDGFQEATRAVSLSQTGLGIVAAATTGKPAIAQRDPRLTGLPKSASWIEKFEANTSLAIPFREPTKQQMVGVFAISTAAFIEPHDALWTRMHEMVFALESSDQHSIASNESVA